MPPSPPSIRLCSRPTENTYLLMYSYLSDIYYPRWSLNPFIRGSYSEGSVEMKDDTIDKLGRSLRGRLHFSGEATSKDWYGYMQGAYLTGQERAKKILRALQSSGNRDYNIDALMV